MQYEDIKEKWTGKVNEIILSDTLKIGGETGLSYAKFEGSFPNKPAVALEINDIFPESWPDGLKESIGINALKDPVEWAKKCENQFDADLIFFNMPGTHQDKQNISAQDSTETMNKVLDATKIPLIIKPDGNFDKINEVVTKCSETAKRKIILGSAVQENYMTIAASAMASGHYIIAESPIDVNIAKQLNILLTQTNFPLEKIIMDPLTGGLGYGLEYTYSVMERIRLQTFNDDKMMNPPMVCLIGPEIWKIKEIKLDDKNMGDKTERGIYWETTTAISLILTGANIITVRHPESVKKIKAFIESLS